MPCQNGGNHGSVFIGMTNSVQILWNHYQKLQQVVSRGGPRPEEYQALNGWFWTICELVRQNTITYSEVGALWAWGGEAFTPKTMQGWALVKPRGYAGDYQIIDGIYQRWTAVEPHLAPWDHFFHWQPATRAVRNRKDYFLALVEEHETARPGGMLVLVVGSGPGRDIYEYLGRVPASRAVFDCLDHDPGAVDFASKLCLNHHRARFLCENPLRFTATEKYDLIWSGGLFDHLNDRHFIFMVQRLATLLVPGGELVIGNFSENNPSRGYMECGNWFLRHRSESHLLSLAASSNIPAEHAWVDSEPEGVNLFLHIRKG